MTDPAAAHVLTDADIADIAKQVTAPNVDPRAMHIPNASVAALIAMLRQAQAELVAFHKQFGEEWGIRWTYTSGIVFEGKVADSEAGARAILNDPEMRVGRSDIASMALIRRVAGGWCEVGDTNA